jgi:hypothetical protein
MTDNYTIDLLSTRDLMALPPPRWLMRGLIPENGIVGLYGPSGEGKSFIALDWANHISEGLEWHGHPTVQTPVVYIAGEGQAGIQKRQWGWMNAHGVTDLPAMYYLLAPLYVREDGVVETFLDTLAARDIWPGLVIIDTLSRSFGGGEENSSADMGAFVDGVTKLAKGRHMSALVVHHMGAEAKRERGHTSFRANLDVMISCKAKKTLDRPRRIYMLTLSNDKQKDDIEADDIFMRPRDDVKETLIFETCDPPEEKKQGDGAPKLMSTQSMLGALRVAENGLTWGEWRLAVGMPKQPFNNRLRKLTAANEIYKDNGRYYIYPATEDLIDIEEDEV